MDEWFEYAGHFLEALNCGAMVIDRAGVVTRVNSRLCVMMRRPAGDVIGRSLLDFYDEPESFEFVSQRRNNFDEPYEGEFHLPLPDGTELPVIFASRVLGHQPPLSDLRLVTLTDISAQKAAENSLKEQYDIIANLSNTILEQA